MASKDLRNRIKTITIVTIFACGLSGAAPCRAQEPGFFAVYPNIDLSRWYLSHGWTNGDHQSCEWRADHVAGADGKLDLKLSDRGGKIRPVGCAEIQSKQRYGYGRYEARLRAAAGSGLNTAFFTYTGPPHGVPVHDEIDFEFPGKEPDAVEVNYHRKGKNMGPFRIGLGFDAAADFHDYAFEWLPDSIRWYVDGRLVYETKEGADIPDSPGKIFFSLWSGAEPLNDWLGPFRYEGPVTAQVEWFRFTPLAERSHTE